MLVPVDAFDLAKLPDHLRVTFAVEAGDGTELARGKDLEALQERLAAPVRDAVAEAFAGELERTGLRAWPDDLDELPRVVETAGGGRAVRGYPALVDDGRHGRRAGVRHRRPSRPPRWARAPAACFGCRCRRRRRPSRSSSTPEPAWCSAPIRTARWPRCSTTAPTPRWPPSRRSRCGAEPSSPRCATGWPRRIAPTTRDVLDRVERVLAALHDVQVALPATPPPAQADAVADIRAQLAALLPAGFVAATGARTCSTWPAT